MQKTASLLLVVLISKLSFCQEVIDSVFVTKFPVRNGVIYTYKPRGFDCIATSPGIAILTPNDSVFNFESAKVVNVLVYEDLSIIVLKNDMDDFICYGNLAYTHLKNGDNVGRNTFLGIAEFDETRGKFLLEIMILKESTQLSFQKELEFIQCKISTLSVASYIL